MSNEKQIIAKLVKLAEKQQLIINKLAQSVAGAAKPVDVQASNLQVLVNGAAGVLGSKGVVVDKAQVMGDHLMVYVSNFVGDKSKLADMLQSKVTSVVAADKTTAPVSKVTVG